MMQIMLPLTDEDKKIIKRTFWLRIIVALIFLVPVLYGVIYGTVDLTIDVFTGKAGIKEWNLLILLIAALSLMLYFFVPLYYTTFSFFRIRHKKIVHTMVTDVEVSHYFRGPHIMIHTNHLAIDSWKSIVLKTEIPLLNIRRGMELEMHLHPDDSSHILLIKSS